MTWTPFTGQSRIAFGHSIGVQSGRKADFWRLQVATGERAQEFRPIAGQSSNGDATHARICPPHLVANGVDLGIHKATLGAFLKMDPRSERFIGNDRANALLTRDYRAPFVVPDRV